MDDNAYKAPESDITLEPNQDEKPVYQWWNIHSRLNRTQYLAYCYGFTGAALTLLISFAWLFSYLNFELNFSRLGWFGFSISFWIWAVLAILFGVVTTLQRINDFSGNRALVLLLFIPLVNSYFIFRPQKIEDGERANENTNTNFHTAFAVMGTLFYLPLITGYSILWILLFDEWLF